MTLAAAVTGLLGKQATGADDWPARISGRTARGRNAA
jgi:hypothetical protein